MKFFFIILLFLVTRSFSLKCYQGIEFKGDYFLVQTTDRNLKFKKYHLLNENPCRNDENTCLVI